MTKVHPTNSTRILSSVAKHPTTPNQATTAQGKPTLKSEIPADFKFNEINLLNIKQFQWSKKDKAETGIMAKLMDILMKTVSKQTANMQP